MRYALVGTGNISNIYVSAIAKLSGSEVVACVSRSGRRPAAAPQLHCAASLSELTMPYDAVIITTPNGLHHQAAIEAAQVWQEIRPEFSLSH